MDIDDISAVFVTHAASILGDTARGLSGNQIVTLTAAYAVDAGVDLPFSTYPFAGRMGTDKRTALFENLMAFPAAWRFRIIRDLCDHKTIRQQNRADADRLKIQLFTQYGHLDPGSSASELSNALIEETRHWLNAFPKSLQLYDDAQQKLQHGVFNRNLLDDLRLALETLLQAVLDNQKSLENQLQPLGSFVKAHEGSPELANMFLKLIDYYCKYQNTYVKHDLAVIEQEVQFIFEITSCFMRHLVRMSGQTEG